jgi:hypothetical protein
VTAAGENNGINGLWEVATNAFDDTMGTKWLDFATAYPSTRQSWIQYQYPSGQRYVVNQYTITSANDADRYPERNPADWRLLGSDDGGASWVTLDIRTNQVFTTNLQKLAYSFTNATAYNVYRFQIDQVANPAQAVAMQLDELEFLLGGLPANCIAKWDGSAWSALGSGIADAGYCVDALALSGTELYAGGYFATADGLATGIAKWDGSAWSALGSGMGGSYEVYALAVSGTNLYAGGQFSTVGGVPANHIAKWDGSAWSALGSGMNDQVFALAADGAGHLFVGGLFSLAGTNVSPYIAQANVGSAPTIITSPQSQTAEIGATVDLSVDVGGGYLTYQLLFNGTNLLSCGTDSCLELTNVNLSQSGTYTVLVTNVFGAVTSSPAMLNVIASVERRPVRGVKVMGEAGSLLNVDYASFLSHSPDWTPLGAVSLTSTSQYYFDLTLPLPPQRFYRAWQTGASGVVPPLDLHTVPAITLTGSIGGSVRVDAINQFGPTDAWGTLATVVMTNTSQLYFDTSSVGQPARLWRIVQLP